MLKQSFITRGCLKKHVQLLSKHCPCILYRKAFGYISLEVCNPTEPLFPEMDNSRRRGRHLTTKELSREIEMLQRGTAQHEVSEKLGVSHTSSIGL